MGGAGNAAGIVAAMNRVTSSAAWASHFTDMSFPYGFYGPEEYRQWLIEAGLDPVRVELVEKDMSYADAAGLAAWIRTTWMPYTHRVPEDHRPQFVDDVVRTYQQLYPPDTDGRIRVAMVRLEVEATARTMTAGGA
jgi:trans-aconitate methyltransferase